MAVSLATMEGSASVRKALSGTLVPSTVTTTVALRQQPEENEPGKTQRKVLDEEQYIEVIEYFAFMWRYCDSLLVYRTVGKFVTKVYIY